MRSSKSARQCISHINKLLVSKPIGPGHPQANLAATQVEALRLYRDVLKTAKHFQWNDKDGSLWADTLRRSVREEFEVARTETDPEIVQRLLVSGQDFLLQAQHKLYDAQQSIVENIDRTRNDRN